MSTLPVEPPEGFKTEFWRLGDANRDGNIDDKDLAYVKSKFGTSDKDADFNGDGKVDILDFSVCAKNQGLNLQTAWNAIRLKELYEEQQAKATGIPNLPWYVDFARTLTDLRNQGTEAFANWIQPILEQYGTSLKAIEMLPLLLPKAETEETTARALKEQEANVDNLVKAYDVIGGGYALEAWQVFQGGLQKFADSQAGVLQAIQRGVPVGKLPSIDEAVRQLIDMRNEIVGLSTNHWFWSGVGEALTLGRASSFKELFPMVSRMYGWEEICAKTNMIQVEKGLLIPTEQFFNRVFTPNIPPYSDLINMRVKEKITQTEFDVMLSMQGFDPYWSGKIWDAHFMPPSLDDVLTAWRRGVISEERVNELMVLIDLDPFYKNVFDTRKYVDPSITLSRYMFEVGAIDEKGVREIVNRNGFNAKDAEVITDFIVRFQERRFRLRYITTLMAGGIQGVIANDEIAKAVTDAGYTLATAVIITRIVDLRKRIAKERKPLSESKLLSAGDIKRLFVLGKINEDRLNQELLERGYKLDEIQLLVELLKDQRSIEEAGGEVKGLSVSELLNAWRYDVISEDDLRTRLLLRELPELEINVMLETKKRQWSMKEKSTSEEEGLFLPKGGE